LQRQEQLKAQGLKLEEVALQFDELTRLLDMHHKRLEMGEKANEALKEDQSVALAEANQRSKERLDELVTALAAAEERFKKLIGQERTERCQNEATVAERLKELSALITELSSTLASTANNIETKLSAEVQHRIEANGRIQTEANVKFSMGLETMQAISDQRHHQQSSQLQSMADDIIAVRENVNQAVSIKIEDFVVTFRRDLDRQIQRREDDMNQAKNFREEISFTTKEIQSGILQETTDRESEDHNLQIAIHELREKADLFKVENDEMLRRVWDAIEMHTHDIRIDDVMDADNAVRRNQYPHSEQTTIQQLPSPTPMQVPQASVIGTMPTHLQNSAAIHVSGSTSHHAGTAQAPMFRPVLQQPQFATRIIGGMVTSPSSTSRTLCANTSLPQNAGHHKFADGGVPIR